MLPADEILQIRNLLVSVLHPMRRTKHYGWISVANSDTPEASKRLVPANPKRTLLLVQNTGANNGVFRFDEQVQGDGTDMLFEPGAGLLYDRADTCPEGALNFGSTAGTTWTIIEQVSEFFPAYLGGN